VGKNNNLENGVRVQMNEFNLTVLKEDRSITELGLTQRRRLQEMAAGEGVIRIMT
jgi:hypothetical protein